MGSEMCIRDSYNGGAKLATSNTGVTITGTAVATTFSGSGASLSSLNADNISSGTLASARIENSAITSDKLANSAVTFAKFQNVAQNHILARSSSGRLSSYNTRIYLLQINIKDGRRCHEARVKP